MPTLCSYSGRTPFLLPLLFVLVSTLPAIGQQQCNSNDPGAPCFAGLKDILNGRRSLLQDDDLVVSGNLSSSDPTGYSAESAFFLSNDSQVSPVSGIMKSGQKVSSNTIAASARMFNAKDAVGISAFASYTSQGNSSVRSFFTIGSGAPTEVDLLNDSAVSPSCNQQLYSVSADFTGNGYDDVVFGAFFPGGCLYKIGMIYKGVQATNPLNPASGFTKGPASQPYYTQSLLFAVTAGTFTDPAPNAPPPLPQIAQLSEGGATGNGLEVKLFSVDPASLLVADTGKSLHLTLPEGNNANIAALAVAAGRFSGGNHDQLAVAYATFGGTAKIITVDFDANGNPLQQTTHDTGHCVYLQQSLTRLSRQLVPAKRQIQFLWRRGPGGPLDRDRHQRCPGLFGNSQLR